MTIRIYILAVVWMGAMGSMAQSSPFQPVAEKTFAVLVTKSGTFTNVTVTTKSKNYVFILHSRGMASVRIADLPLEAQEELGYAVAKETTANRTVVLARQLVPDIDEKIKPLEAQWRSGLQSGRETFEINRPVAIAVLGVFVLLYFFFCYCAHLICIKAGQPASLLVWLPGLQMIPLFRAARMSGWWFLATVIPAVNLVVHILWSLNIAKARGKSVLVGILLILPVTNVLAFLYLAFSGDERAEDDGAAHKSMSLQTA